MYLGWLESQRVCGCSKEKRELAGLLRQMSNVLKKAKVISKATTLILQARASSAHAATLIRRVASTCEMAPSFSAHVGGRVLRHRDMQPSCGQGCA